MKAVAGVPIRSALGLHGLVLLYYLRFWLIYHWPDAPPPGHWHTEGFVGLIAPHAGRLLVGPHHRRLTLASALVGIVLVQWIVTRDLRSAPGTAWATVRALLLASGLQFAAGLLMITVWFVWVVV